MARTKPIYRTDRTRPTATRVANLGNPVHNDPTRNIPAEGYPEEEPGKPGPEKPTLRELPPPKQAEAVTNPRDGVSNQSLKDADRRRRGQGPPGPR